ncbi:MAG: Thymidylate kinase [Candidatus Woesearchaeota archaeon]|nr:Thymidylate kinase [Candidatus Woesearchaeota archaeon]
MLIIEGTIAAGKTTLVEVIDSQWNQITREQRRVEVLPELVDENPFFDDYMYAWNQFYNNGTMVNPGICFKAQLWFLTRGYTQLKDAVTRAEESKDNILVVKDRSMFGDRLFCEKLLEDGLIEQSQFSIYLDLFEILSTRVKSSLLAYLDTDPRVAFERMNKRNRQGEEGYTQRYFESLGNRYENFFHKFPYNKLRIPYNKPDISVQSDKKQVILQIHEGLNGALNE